MGRFLFAMLIPSKHCQVVLDLEEDLFIPLLLIPFLAFFILLFTKKSGGWFFFLFTFLYTLELFFHNLFILIPPVSNRFVASISANLFIITSSLVCWFSVFCFFFFFFLVLDACLCFRFYSLYLHTLFSYVSLTNKKKVGTGRGRPWRSGCREGRGGEDWWIFFFFLTLS